MPDKEPVIGLRYIALAAFTVTQCAWIMRLSGNIGAQAIRREAKISRWRCFVSQRGCFDEKRTFVRQSCRNQQRADSLLFKQHTAISVQNTHTTEPVQASEIK